MCLGLTSIVLAINAWPWPATIALALFWVAAIAGAVGGPRRPQF